MSARPNLVLLAFTCFFVLFFFFLFFFDVSASLSFSAFGVPLSTSDLVVIML